MSKFDEEIESIGRQLMDAGSKAFYNTITAEEVGKIADKLLKLARTMEAEHSQLLEQHLVLQKAYIELGGGGVVDGEIIEPKAIDVCQICNGKGKISGISMGVLNFEFCYKCKGTGKQSKDKEE